MSELLPALSSAFIVGLLGSGHCVGMCGGIATALGAAIPAQRSRLKLVLSYNLGRVTTYLLLGALVGWLISLNPHFLHSGHSISITRILAGVLLILMGLYLSGLWYGLIWLERVGGLLWRRLQPFAQKLLPVKTTFQALLLGLIWGWLPCGLVYSALAFSATQANWWMSGLTMLAFGLGTLPAMAASGFFAARLKQWLQKRSLRLVMGLLVVLMGLWVLFPLFGMGHAHG